MPNTFRLGIALLLTGIILVSVGCSARQVYRDADQGVVAIPYNSNSWPMRYREKADEMMASHFPDGYEIVSEGEAVIGQTTHYDEDSSGGEIEVVKDFLSIGASETRGTTTTTDNTEYRIHYRRR